MINKQTLSGRLRLLVIAALFAFSACGLSTQAEQTEASASSACSGCSQASTCGSADAEILEEEGGCGS